MEKLKVHIWHVMCEFKINKNTTEIAKKICVSGQVVITDRQVRNWFSKFCSTDWERNWGQDALRELVEYNQPKNLWELALDLNTSWSTICCHLKKDKKRKQVGYLGSSYSKWKE